MERNDILGRLIPLTQSLMGALSTPIIAFYLLVLSENGEAEHFNV